MTKAELKDFIENKIDGCGGVVYVTAVDEIMEAVEKYKKGV